MERVQEEWGRAADRWLRTNATWSRRSAWSGAAVQPGGSLERLRALLVENCIGRKCGIWCHKSSCLFNFVTLHYTWKEGRVTCRRRNGGTILPVWAPCCIVKCCVKSHRTGVLPPRVEGLTAHSSPVTNTNEGALDKMDRTQWGWMQGGPDLKSFSAWHVAASHISRKSQWWMCWGPSNCWVGGGVRNCTARLETVFNSSAEQGWGSVRSN